MGRHTRPRERRPLRPVALTSVLAVGVVGAIAAAGLFSVHLRDVRHPSTDSVAMAGSTPGTTASAAASPSASPSPSTTPTTEALGAPQPIDPTDGAVRQLPPTAPPDVTLGVTATAVDNAESRRVGALFTGGTGAGNHFCSASVIDSPGRNLILTAAHCLTGASGITFVPGYRDGQAPYGSWQVTKVYTAAGWRSDGDPDEDFAILAVAPSGGRQIEDALGGNPIAADAAWTVETRLYGYPAGTEQPVVCTNSTSREDTYQRRIDCPSFPGGTSGGPFLDAATGAVIGVIGGYQQGGDTDDTSYSAYFDHTVTELLAAAS
ncbi:serine protease [Streptomyces sp. TLI_171]|uniref:trypsin-like serine peptidase n=1 Tax=Streptomyces sp. TLI_171 TaxID=1938859 RepID=UPI000C19AE48|nr:serine protease [Streptomyces sp. TLI_171]RKE21131.1 trypsin-like peptidase [Streptomyces sp. TLI_171]